MHTRVQLVVTRLGAVRLCKAPPRVRRGEVSLRLAIIIPDECFTSPLVNVAVVTQSDQLAPDEVFVDVESAQGEPE